MSFQLYRSLSSLGMHIVFALFYVIFQYSAETKYPRNVEEYSFIKRPVIVDLDGFDESVYDSPQKDVFYVTVNDLHSVNSFCNPPNPCPLGINDGFCDPSPYKKFTEEYSRHYQQQQDCLCDRKHDLCEARLFIENENPYMMDEPIPQHVAKKTGSAFYKQ